MMMPPCPSVAGRFALYGVSPRTEQNGTRHLIPTTATCRALLHLPTHAPSPSWMVVFFKGVCYCIYKIFIKIKRWRIGRCLREGGKRTLNAYCCVCINKLDKQSGQLVRPEGAKWNPNSIFQIRVQQCKKKEYLIL